jgi:hypothetical protein
MRRRQFNRLALSTVSATKMRLKKRKAKKKKAVDFVWLNTESPYAEYLPDRYREWAPKEPKDSRNVITSPNFQISTAPKFLSTTRDMKMLEMSKVYQSKADLSASRHPRTNLTT